MQREQFATSVPSVADLIRITRPARPVLCLDRTRVAQRAKQFLENFPGTVLWALKVNPHPSVVRAVIEAGVSAFDVASRSEIAQIREQFPAADLQYNHPVKPPDDIAYAIGIAGVTTFTIDDQGELEKILDVVHSIGVNPQDFVLLVRFRGVEVVDAVYDFGSKFGATPEHAALLLKECHKAGFGVGLAFHPGSQTRDPHIYARMMVEAAGIRRAAFGEQSSMLRCLNVGGGFPCRYPDGREPPLGEYFRVIRVGSLANDCPIVCEPGRAIVADSMSLVAQVTLRRPDGRIYINDGFYGSFMEMQFVDFSPPVRAYRPDGQLIRSSNEELASFTVFGPTCDSIDRLPRPVRLPQTLATGDYLEFGLMGAYTNASATSFNGIDRATLVEVDSLDQWAIADWREDSTLDVEC